MRREAKGKPDQDSSLSVEISRRALLLGSANVLVLSVGGAVVAASQGAVANADQWRETQEPQPTSEDAIVVPHREVPDAGRNPSYPTSDDAEIIPWGEFPHGHPQSQNRDFVSKPLLLQGNWAGVRLTHAMAWGEGHEGKDVWSSEVALCKEHGFYQIKFTGLAPHPHCLGYYLFIIELETADSKSDRIAATFRYTYGRGYDGVFAAAFRFPLV